MTPVKVLPIPLSQPYFILFAWLNRNSAFILLSGYSTPAHAAQHGQHQLITNLQGVLTHGWQPQDISLVHSLWHSPRSLFRTFLHFQSSITSPLFLISFDVLVSHFTGRKEASRRELPQSPIITATVLTYSIFCYRRTVCASTWRPPLQLYITSHRLLLTAILSLSLASPIFPSHIHPHKHKLCLHSFKIHNSLFPLTTAPFLSFLHQTSLQEFVLATSTSVFHVSLALTPTRLWIAHQ